MLRFEAQDYFRFDSILVRLKANPENAYSDRMINCTFRFHTGSIKRLHPKLTQSYVKIRIPFRFHTGSIKSCDRNACISLIGEIRVSIPYWFD